MPLRIVIDARRIRDFGFGTYIRNLVRSLSAIDGTNHYTLVTTALDYPELTQLRPNFTLACFTGSANTLLSEVAFPLFLRRLSADLYHLPLNVVPLGMPDPYVVTIHDLSSLMFTKPYGIRNKLRVARFRRGLANAACVIAVSNATRRDVETVTGMPPSRIRTIYNAPDPAFGEPAFPAHDCMREGTHDYPPEMQRILDRYQIQYPFLLYAGRTSSQKNIPRLVEAFSVLKGELAQDPMYKELRLIIIGDEISRFPALRQAVNRSRVENAVRFLGFVPIETLRVFYQAAVAFVFPSLYEGFGLPPLEAMACGTPVITSNVSSLPEVVGDAAVQVNPENVFEIARGIREVLLDRELRGTLVQKGYAQVKRFSWTETAVQVLKTYERVVFGA